MRDHITRTALAAAAAGMVTIGGAGAAHAAGVSEPTPLSRAQVTAATAAASGDHGLTLARRVVEAQGNRSGNAALRRAAKGNAALVGGTTTQVNVLNRDFVAAGSGPVGKLGYVANTARVGDQLVSVWTAPVDGGWKAVNAAAGDVEARLARNAQGGQVLYEPQINAWYSVKGHRVHPLNGEARAAVGAGMSLEDYQRLVHGKYADKMPGSPYDRSGMAGGFGEPAAQPQTATQPQQAGTSPVLLAGVGLAGAAGVAGLVFARRRRVQG